MSAIKPDYDDGIHFNIDSVEAQEIRKAAGYPGVRVTMEALLSGARIAVQCDIGFGDAVTPAPMVKSYPALLDMPAPKLRVYPLETVVAEKLEAIVKLAGFNSRMKDFFDLWILSRYEKLDHKQLPNAVRATFERCKTAFPVQDPVGLTNEFAAEKQAAWNAFLRRSSLTAPPLAEVIVALREAYLPVIKAIQ